MRILHRLILPVLLMPALAQCQRNTNEGDFVKNNYDKQEVYIPMRDGMRLYTVIYTPKDKTQPHPFLMERTPYGSGPYGDTLYRRSLGPNRTLMHELYIFVYQDVRGRYMSEGQFEEMTPARDDPHNANKKPDASGKQTDESSDTWDTVDWLIKNVKNNNGRVGIYGISYPGFYASASLPDAHPAIKCVSPQAPVTDEFIGDDANHNGAFFLLDNFDFDNFFDIPRPTPVKHYSGNLFRADYNDAYKFFLNLGPLKNANKPEYFNNKGKIWNEYMAGSTYAGYWEARNIRPHLKNIRPATLLVGGWFDAEDMFGSLRTYEAIEQQTPNNDNHIIMGPWTHGGWAGGGWNRFGILDFGQNVNDYFHDIETKFYDRYLLGKDSGALPEAMIFETGTNKWKTYNTWPPKEATPIKLLLMENNRLGSPLPPPTNALVPVTIRKDVSYDQYVSDPANPVPYIDGIRGGRDNQYIVTDQRFASQRSDVLFYQTDPLSADLTVTGRLRPDIWLSSSGTDADLIVKLIDVFPDTAANPGYQRLVRAEVFRCKFRNSYEKPEALTPGQPAEIAFNMNEIAHCFKKGHRIMVQLQSSWFPLVDLNPQTFVNIPTANESDFQKATIRIWHDAAHPSGIALPVMQ
jgi:putative CocE/NonD family hydrolase